LDTPFFMFNCRLRKVRNQPLQFCRIKLFLVCLVLCSVSSQGLAYSDPEIKVLIAHSTKGIIVSSPENFTIDSDPLSRFYRTVQIKPDSKSALIVDGNLFRSQSVVIRPESIFQVSKNGSSFKRRYEGFLELVPSKNGFYIINHIPVEAYLEGVLNAEISTAWPIEVVKAQSVIARTYALYKRKHRKNKLWHVSSSHSDQVYKGINISDQRGIQAIQQTRGIVVEYQGKLAQTFYHSNCGGITEDPRAIWTNSIPYLTVKSVPYGKKDPRFSWETSFSQEELQQVLRRAGLKVNNINSLSILDYTSSGRVNQLSINRSETLTLPAAEFRKHAGYGRVQSLLFDVIRVPGGFHFKGKGNGHGVGLSQWSAKEMAEIGYRYHEILYFFYNGIKLARYQF
jgi:stage II sporulation protein D (peptidoglycan lytic transglycosylase)